MSGWISAKDRLPTKKDHKYLWVNDNYENVVLWYDDKDGTIGIGGYVMGYVPCWTDINHDRIDGVTHWMPLPDKPTPKEKRNLIGQKFGRLTIIKKTDKRKSDGSVVWICKCDCGNECEVATNNLRSGNTQSCGCLKRHI